MHIHTHALIYTHMLAKATYEDSQLHGLTPLNAHAFLLDQLYAVLPHARHAAAALSPRDAAQLEAIPARVAAVYWQNITRELESCRDGVLLFANARSIGDTCLVLAARLAGVRSVVMELANLHPTLVDVDAVLSPSYFAASHPSVVRALRTRKTYVLSTGIDTDVFAPSPLSPPSPPPSLSSLERVLRQSPSRQHFVVGYVGRIATEKSVGLVLAMARAVAPMCSHCRFRVVGDGALKTHLQTLARDWDLAHVVAFADGIYDNEAQVARELQRMHAYFLPSFSETLGIAGLEAMSVGLPVIGFRAGGTGEYLVDNYNGIVLRDATPDAMRTAVESLVNDPARWTRLGQNARQTVVERFSRAKSVPQYAALYERLARRPVALTTQERPVQD